MNSPKTYLFVALFGASLSAFHFAGCGAHSADGSGSSTHFLKQCSSATDCGEDLTCLCGRCTEICSKDAECSSLDDGALCGEADQLDGTCSKSEGAMRACVAPGKGSTVEPEAEPDAKPDTDGGPQTPGAECSIAERRLDLQFYEGEAWAGGTLGCSPGEMEPFVVGQVTQRITEGDTSIYSFELCDSVQQGECHDERELRLEFSFYESASSAVEAAITLWPDMPEHFVYAAECTCGEGCGALNETVMAIDDTGTTQPVWTANTPMRGATVERAALGCSSPDDNGAQFYEYTVTFEGQERFLTQGQVVEFNSDDGLLEVEILDGSTFDGLVLDAIGDDTQYIMRWTDALMLDDPGPDGAEPDADGSTQVDEELERARALWDDAAVQNYEMKVKMLCFCPQDPTTDVAVTVSDGNVTEALGYDAEASDYSVELGAGAYEQWYTVEGLFDLIEEQQTRAASVTVEYDPDFGFPVSVQVDAIANAVDDEYTIQVQDFGALAQP